MKTITTALEQLFLTVAFTATCLTLGVVVVAATPLVFMACVFTIATGGKLKVSS